MTSARQPRFYGPFLCILFAWCQSSTYPLSSPPSSFSSCPLLPLDHIQQRCQGHVVLMSLTSSSSVMDTRNLLWPAMVLMLVVCIMAAFIHSANPPRYPGQTSLEHRAILEGWSMDNLSISIQCSLYRSTILGISYDNPQIYGRCTGDTRCFTGVKKIDNARS